MVDYQFVTERLAIGGYIGTAENMRELSRAGAVHDPPPLLQLTDRDCSLPGHGSVLRSPI